MKTLHNTNHGYFFSKTTFFAALLAVLVMAFSQPACASGPARPCAMQQKGGTILLHLGETMSGSQTITVENLLDDGSGFSNIWWSVNPTENMQSVAFSNISGATLPANSEVALVTVNDPEYGFTHHFLLGTDGGAIILILGDF